MITTQEKKTGSRDGDLKLKTGFVIFCTICVLLFIVFGYLGITGQFETWLWLFLNLSVLTVLLIIILLYLLKFHTKK